MLDDCWEAKQEKQFNCISPDNASRVLVTTRIRGLLKNAAEVEVGVLSQTEALALLLSSAETDADDLEDGSDEHRFATEIVELCGRLPLTLAIGGGMIADNGQGFTEDILDVMKETQELEDEEGMTVEARVISSSVKMMIKGAGKHQDLVEKVFRFFACFPEDVPVPAPFFNKMAPLLSDDKNEKKARLAIGSCLGTLLKYNLIKGSLLAGNGVFMHDIVRDYVMLQHSEEELRNMQKSVVAAILAARPPKDGFPSVDVVSGNRFEGYVARQMWWHIKQSLDEADNELLPENLVTHPDSIIKINAATAAGFGNLVKVSEELEAAGDLVKAATFSWLAHMPKTICHLQLAGG